MKPPSLPRASPVVRVHSLVWLACGSSFVPLRRCAVALLRRAPGHLHSCGYTVATFNRNVPFGLVLRVVGDQQVAPPHSTSGKLCPPPTSTKWSHFAHPWLWRPGATTPHSYGDQAYMSHAFVWVAARFQGAWANAATPAPSVRARRIPQLLQAFALRASGILPCPL